MFRIKYGCTIYIQKIYSYIHNESIRNVNIKSTCQQLEVDVIDRCRYISIKVPSICYNEFIDHNKIELSVYIPC